MIMGLKEVCLLAYLISLICCSLAISLGFLPTETIFFVCWISQEPIGFQGEEYGIAYRECTAACLPGPHQLYSMDGGDEKQTVENTGFL